jgi:16S rRNA G966 N2-methylase RsmD
VSAELELATIADVPALIQRERRALVGLADPIEIAEVERRAAAIAELTKRAGLAVPVQNEAMLYRAEALERLAVVVAEAQKNGEIRKQGERQQLEQRSDARTFAEAKIDKRRLAEGRALAETDVLDKARADAKQRPDKPIRFADIVRRAERIRRVDAGVEKRRLLEQEARANRARQEALGIQPFRLDHADARTWRPGSPIHAIITDPPYITSDAVELYSALADLAVEALEPGGALAVMVWTPMLVDVIDALRRPELVYRWTIAWQFSTHNTTANHQRRVYDATKFVLVYHHGEMPRDAAYFRDFIAADDAVKDLHVWQQDLAGFEVLVDRFSLPGDTVCDPFAGSGTTAIAALRAERRFVGCDLDEHAVRIALQRIEP